MNEHDDNPFLFGKVAAGKEFNNREVNRKELRSLILNGINTTLISPRRWGKTSLIQRVRLDMQSDENVKFCVFDMFSVTDEESFYSSFSKELLKSTFTKVEELVNSVTKFLGSFSPQISLGFDPMNTLEIGLNIKNTADKQTILNLPQTIAKEKGIKLVVCFDEFQNIEHFTDSKAFQKQLRAAFQNHPDVTYIFYGSKRHMMNTMFSKRNMPFYKFGEVIFLDKISEEHWIPFLQTKFKSKGKSLPVKMAKEIASRMTNNPYYVQQYAYHVFEKTQKKVTEEVLDEALNLMLDRNSLFFERETSYISSLQINILKAITAGNDTGLTKGAVISKYKLNSSSAVVKGLQALEKKDVIDRFTGKVEYVDPLFSIWIQRVYRVQ